MRFTIQFSLPWVERGCYESIECVVLAMVEPLWLRSRVKFSRCGTRYIGIIVVLEALVATLMIFDASFTRRMN